MISETQYFCEKCGNGSLSKEEIITCESSHITSSDMELLGMLAESDNRLARNPYARSGAPDRALIQAKGRFFVYGLMGELIGEHAQKALGDIV